VNFLVVDDNPDILHLVSSILKLFGHGADEANDGREAVRQFQNNRYDVVITDAEMPYVDGSELCKFLKSQSPGIYIIGISGSSSALEGLKDAGADICLSKPFSMHALEEAIENQFHSSQPDFASPQPIA
jgi:two-component system sensor histidine kinase EvgS